MLDEFANEKPAATAPTSGHSPVLFTVVGWAAGAVPVYLALSFLCWAVRPTIKPSSEGLIKVRPPTMRSALADLHPDGRGQGRYQPAKMAA